MESVKLGIVQLVGFFTWFADGCHISALARKHHWGYIEEELEPS
jgi:hypothetical protein